MLTYIVVEKKVNEMITGELMKRVDEAMTPNSENKIIVMTSTFLEALCNEGWGCDKKDISVQGDVVVYAKYQLRGYHAEIDDTLETDFIVKNRGD